MAPSRLRLFLSGLLLCALGQAQAALLTYNWNATWVLASPDGHTRPVIGINGQWPLPLLNATIGDRVLINFSNGLGNRTTSLHFHGLYMNGTSHMDGPVSSSQCSIGPGASFVYDFNITQTGTYWYHAHADGQYPDGLRGPVVLHNATEPYQGQYDEELILSLSDWYHDFMPNLIASFISVTNPTGGEPVPNGALMNDTQNLKVMVEPGKTYLIRIVNMGAFAGQYFWFEGHKMRIVEVDGVWTQATEADMLYITAAQRYSVLLTTKNDTSKNFAISGSMDKDLFDKVPDSLNPNVTGWLVYDQAKPLPKPTLIDAFEPFDDFTLAPYDQEPLFENVDYSFELNFHMGDLGDGANYAFFNNVTYVMPKVPSLYTAITSGRLGTTSTVPYGGNSNAFLLQQGQVIEIVINSADPGKHPFHLHGHNFQVVWKSDEDGGSYGYNESLRAVPMRRDTFMVSPNGNIVLRFRADNPGVWLLHCHIEWHIDAGLVATMIEAPAAIQERYGHSIDSLPPSHIEACRARGQPYRGNAAGNTADLMDLSGENVAPAPLPVGFTARGIVALVFSCVSAVLGMMAIVWYGAYEIKPKVGRA